MVTSKKFDDWTKSDEAMDVAIKQEFVGHLTRLSERQDHLEDQSEHQEREIEDLRCRVGSMECFAKLLVENNGSNGRRLIGNGSQQFAITSSVQGSSNRAASKKHSELRSSAVKHISMTRRYLQPEEVQAFQLDQFALSLNGKTDLEVARLMTTTMVSFGGSEVSILDALRARGFNSNLADAIAATAN
jgi:hypothetical protein